MGRYDIRGSWHYFWQRMNPPWGSGVRLTPCQRHRLTLVPPRGPWEALYCGVGYRILFRGRIVGERKYLIKPTPGGGGKVPKFLMRQGAEHTIARCADLHQKVPFDPDLFGTIFAWGEAAGVKV